MINRFLNKKNYSQLKLLYLLTQNEKCSFEELSNKVKLDISMIRRYIIELNKELHSFPDNVAIEQNGFFVKIKHYSNMEQVDVYTRMKTSYLEKSLLFQLTVLFFTHNKLTIGKICEQLVISSSHAYRLINEFQKVVLAESKIYLKKNANSYYFLSGEELSIRLFMFQLVKECIENELWVFLTISKIELQNNFREVIPDLSSSDPTQNKLFIYLAVFNNRMKLRKTVPVISNKDTERYLQQFSVFSKEQLFCYFDRIGLYDVETRESEYIYFSFCCRVFLPEFVSPDKDISLSGELVHQWSDPVGGFLTRFIDEWIDEFQVDIPYEKKMSTLYFCFVLYLFTAFLDVNLVNMWYTDVRETKETVHFNVEVFRELHAFCHRYIEKNEKKQLGNMKVVVLNMTSLLYIQTFLYRKRRMAIYLFFDNDYTAHEFIRTYLGRLYNEDKIRFTEIIGEADLIITDQIKLDTGTQNKICLSTGDFLDLDSLKNIVKEINEFLIN